MSFITPPRLEDGELHQGEIKLSGAPDPFESDDERYFTFKVRPPLKVLIVSDIAVRGRVRRGRARSRSRAVAPQAVPGRSGARPPSFGSRYQERSPELTPAFSCSTSSSSTRPTGGRSTATSTKEAGWWSRPGTAVKPANYNNPIASQLLPAQLAERPKTAQPQTTFGKVANITHPLFQRYGKDLDSMLAQVPVYSYWPVKQRRSRARARS